MIAPELDTDNPAIRLVAPEIDRDAPLGVTWLSGEAGRDTLRLMGVAEKDNVGSDLESERKRVTDFIVNKNQLNWMIQYQDIVVGAIWVDLIEKEGVSAPSVHLMIGDPNVRGKGIGSSALQAVLGYLHSLGNTSVYSRHIVPNIGSAKLLAAQGFASDGQPYTDRDGVTFQNVALKLEP